MQQDTNAGLSVGLVWPGYVLEKQKAEVMRFLPASVRLHMRGTQSEPRSGSENITLEKVMQEAIKSDIEDTAAALAAHGPAAVGYGCTSVSYVHGVKGEREIRRRMAEGTGLPVATTAGAVVAALRHLSIERVAVLSPHIDALNERLRLYLQESRFEVVALEGLNMRESIEGFPPARILDLVASLDLPEADGIFVSCTGMMTSTIITDAEGIAGKPVVTANQATIWQLLRLAGAQRSIPNLGCLYSGVIPAQ